MAAGSFNGEATEAEKKFTTLFLKDSAAISNAGLREETRLIKGEGSVSVFELPTSWTKITMNIYVT